MAGGGDLFSEATSAMGSPLDSYADGGRVGRRWSFASAAREEE